MGIGFLFNEILVRPIITVLVAIYQALILLHIPYALGFSIIFLTIFIRVVLYPLTKSQLKASKKMQDIAPHISKLKEKHKGDASRLQQETMRLYKEHGINPAAGCLPMLVQLPLIWALYSVLQEVVAKGPKDIVSHVNNNLYIEALRLNQPWDQTFFGIPLGQNPTNLIGSMPLIVLVPVLTGVFQFIQSKMMVVKPQEIKKEDKKVAKIEEKTKKGDDFSAAFQTQSLYIFPVMIGFFSYSFPIGLSLYWNTFTLFGILQQYRISGWGGMEPWKNKVKAFLGK